MKALFFIPKRDTLFQCILIVSFFLIGFSNSNSQCVLTTNSYTEAEVLACLTACGCSTVQIPDGETIDMNGSWNLNAAGDITIEILGSGSLIFSGSGSSADELILTDGSSLIIEDPTNTNAIVQTGGNGNVRILLGDFKYDGNDFAEIIAAGGVGPEGPLPIELLSYDVIQSGNVAKINWTTGSELSLSHFVIETSLDGRTFDKLITVNPQENERSVKTYTHTTGELRSGTHYFRLRAFDYDGFNEVFSIKSIQIDGRSEISVYPNPVKQGNVLSIENSQEMGEITLLDVSGREVKVFENISSKSFKLETGDLLPGIYFVKTAGRNLDNVQQITIK